MGLIQVSASIAANAVNTNVLSGNPLEFVSTDSLVEIAVLGSVTGLRATVSSGQDLLMGPEAEVSIVAAANQFPKYPDDYILQDFALAGDRLVIAIRNTTGAAITVFVGLRVTAV